MQEKTSSTDAKKPKNYTSNLNQRLTHIMEPSTKVKPLTKRLKPLIES